jgi:hypothetical protein
MKKYLLKANILFAVLGFVVIQGCSSPGILTQAPNENYLSIDYKPKPSLISVPIDIDVKSIETLINKKLNGLIYEDNSLTNNNNDNLMLKVWKRDNFKIDMEGDILSYRIPLKIWAKAGFKFQKLGITISDYRDLNCEIALKFRTKITLNKDLSLTTKTVSDGYQWITAPTVNIAGYNMPVTFIADAILKYNQTMIGSEVDNAIKTNLDIKKMIDEPWKMIQKPYKMSDEYKMWLKITPLEVYSQPLLSKNNKIHNVISFKTLTETFIGNEPAYKVSPTPAQINIQNNINNGFEVNVLSDIPFTEATEMAKKYIVGKTFEGGGKKVTVKGMNLYGSNGKIIVAADVEGSVKGKIYFAGVPYYDIADSTIKVSDFDFELHTKGVLLKSAAWLMHGPIVKMIQKRLEFSMADNIKDSKKMLQKTLSSYEMGMGTTLKGKLDDFNIEGVMLTHESIKASIVFKGKLNVLVNPGAATK